MPKQKLRRFAEVNDFPNCHYLSFETARDDQFPLKGNWGKNYFKNNGAITLELACGKGEYTVDLGRKFPDGNFIGIDIKGNRIWKGAKIALDENLNQVAFLRTRIDFIEKAFAPEEVSEIWITFPDPQPRKEKKRLTAPAFLEKYKGILKKSGIIHLKTDDRDLFDFSVETFSQCGIQILEKAANLYGESRFANHSVTQVRTYYENKFLVLGKKICYLSGKLTEGVFNAEP